MEQVLVVGLLAMVLEYLDSSFGMGYGTILTPLFLLMGFNPLQIVPAILVSELFTGSAAAMAHHKVKNVDFHWKSQATKIAAVFIGCSLVGVVTAVLVAVELPKQWLMAYIGFMVLVVGLLVFFSRKKTPKFSWKKVCCLGAVASFNKGISGGGYGPLLTGGQVATGVNPKNAVAITSLAESVTCLAGLLTYFFMGATVDWSLAPVITVGALMAIPFTALTVKKINPEKMTSLMGVFITLLGLMTLAKLFT
jgi:hypothetical protein